MRVLPFVTMLAAASPVAAQSPLPDVAAQARDLTFERSQPFAGLNEVGALTRFGRSTPFMPFLEGDIPTGRCSGRFGA